MNTGTEATAPRLAAGGSPAVRLRGISKRFGTTQALTHVDLDIAPGTIHCLLGENGAGKSTIGKMLSGLYLPDGGSIEINGREARIESIRAAQHLGIGCVFQELSLAADLSVQANMCLGAEGRSAIRAPDGQGERLRCRELLDRLGVDVPLKARTGDLPTAQQQLIEVAKALYRNSNIIILDEPTAMLGATEVRQLFQVIRELKEAGTTFVFVTHHMDEVRTLGDRMSVLRDGRMIQTLDVSPEVTDAQIISLLTGPMGDPIPAQRKPRSDARTLLSMDSPTGAISVKEGEIVSIYGVAGCGREEFLNAAVGLGGPPEMTMQLDAAPYAPTSPARAHKRGVNYLPSGRALNAVLTGRSIRENLSISQLRALSKRGVVSRSAESKAVHQQLNRLRTKYGDESDPIESLSGGNQQKIFLARCLQADGCRVAVLEDPTAGVDIAAKHELHRLMVDFTQQGGAILLVSSDLSETLALSSRIYTMFAGQVVREYSDPPATSRDQVIADVLGGTIH